jgi:hypothetical protein
MVKASEKIRKLHSQALVQAVGYQKISCQNGSPQQDAAEWIAEYQGGEQAVDHKQAWCLSEDIQGTLQDIFYGNAEAGGDFVYLPANVQNSFHVVTFSKINKNRTFI